MKLECKHSSVLFQQSICLVVTEGGCQCSYATLVSCHCRIPPIEHSNQKKPYSHASSSEVLSVLLFVYQGKVGMKTKEKKQGACTSTHTGVCSSWVVFSTVGLYTVTVTQTYGTKFIHSCLFLDPAESSTCTGPASTTRCRFVLLKERCDISIRPFGTKQRHEQVTRISGTMNFNYTKFNTQDGMKGRCKHLWV